MDLDKQNFNAISKHVPPYNNFIVDVINDHCLRMAIMEGEYKWHYHKYTDELFIVLEGELKIEIKENDTVFLKPGSLSKFRLEQFIKQAPQQEL
jgi:mannose-6-phosphate isomerase-like protein (cupin superfamily)